MKVSCEGGRSMGARRRWRIGANLLIAAALLTSGAHAAYNFAEIDQLAEGALEGQFVASPVPGFEILVLRHGEPVYRRSFGAWTPGRVAAIDSTTKTLSGAVILAVADDDAAGFSLDRPIADYLPAFDTSAKRGITVRQAFSHTAGFGSGGGSVLSDASITLAQAANQIAGYPLLYAPGTQFLYGGLSMHAAGAAAEAATAVPFAELLAQRITRPMEMINTRFYTASEEHPRVAGGVRSTAAEFSRFMDMLLLEGRDRVTGERILSVEAVRAMFTRQTTDTMPILSSPTDNSRYGVGVWLDQLEAHGPPVFALAAGARGFHSWIDPERGLVYTFATDRTTWGNVADLASRIHAALVKVVDEAGVDRTQGRLDDVEVRITPANTPSLSARFSGGFPFGHLVLQSSKDLGQTDPWREFLLVPLDGYGRAALAEVVDPRPEAATAKSFFYRAVALPPPSR